MKSRRKQTFASRNRRLLSVFYRTPVFTEHRLSRPRISVNPMLPHMLSIQDREATGPITGMAFRSSVPA